MDLPSFLALCSNQTPHGRVRVPFFTNNLYVCSLLEDSWPKPVSEEQEEKAACKLMTLFCFLLLPQRTDYSQLRAMIIMHDMCLPHFAWVAAFSL